MNFNTFDVEVFRMENFLCEDAYFGVVRCLDWKIISLFLVGFLKDQT